MQNDRRIKFLQNQLKNPVLIKKKENLLYLTGRFFVNGYLLVKPLSTKHLALITDVIFLGDGLEKVDGIHSGILKNLRMYLGRYRVLQIEDIFSFAEYNYIKSKLKNPPLLIPPPRGGRRVGVEPVRSPVDYQRMIKDDSEIALIQKSMNIVARVFEQVKRQLRKKHWTEIKLAEFIKTAGFKLGAEDISFPPIVASGVNAATPHHVPSNKKLKAGESVIIDFGFKYKNYCSDFTRTVFLKRVPKRLEIVYNQAEKAYNESMRFIEDGPLGLSQRAVLKGGDVYQRAVDVLKQKKLDKYFVHSLGHGTGLEIHELPNLSPGSKDILQNGMVFSIEPGVYIPKIGGIRIEDLVYLKKGQVKKFIDISLSLNHNIL